MVLALNFELAICGSTASYTLGPSVVECTARVVGLELSANFGVEFSIAFAVL